MLTCRRFPTHISFALKLSNAGASENSYSFDGQFGTLDYALSSDSLTSQIGGVTVWQINSDELAALDYKLNVPSTVSVMVFCSPVNLPASTNGIGRTIE